MENLHRSSPYEGTDFGTADSSFAVPWSSSTSSSSSSAFQLCGFPSLSMAINEDKATAASKSHSQAEKRRRDRINSQLSTLRKLIPKSDKMDKAALLGSVIEHVKDLKRKATEIGKSLTVPTEVDEIIIDNQISDQDMKIIGDHHHDVDDDDETPYIRASLCCDDRPELFSELIQVLSGLGLTAVGADVSTIGDRIKSVLILSSKDGVADNNNNNSGERVCVINSLRQSLKLVLTKIASQSMTTNCRVRSKRQRFFLPSHHHQ